MLTQLELLNASGASSNDDDSGMSLSPLDGLSEYSIVKTEEFEYFESNLGSDSYYDISPTQELQDSLPPPPCLTPTAGTAPSAFGSATLYDTSISSRGDGFRGHDDDVKVFDEDLKPLNEALESSSDFSSGLYDGNVELTDVKIKIEEETSTYDAFSTDVYDNSIATEGFNLGSWYDTFDASLHASETTETKATWDEAASKGKIGPLQRRALDSIFNVTEKPSRGLVLHIASELGLHHITVKNFFSNGRRRLRRAAARLNDPERTRRENERRKEKRRLAARASAAALSNGDTNKSCSGSGSSSSSSSSSSAGSLAATKSSMPTTVESPPPKETTFVSLERRALMEKLADKVQRSKAQRSLTSDPGVMQSTTSSTSTTSQDFLSQSTQDLLIHPISDILSQASQDILSHSSQGLLAELPHDFLAEPTHDLSQTSSLLNPNTDPWNFF
ncbi:uncharacterized protein LOC135209990 [Macrobrachium nipponense]|uniref:uncharacterized protein LOC135209990 n=1 Tax=Macrobrachium nipponense TaxID=159736 RepID=UPI0030C898A1